MIPKRIIFTIVDTLPDKYKPFVKSFKDYNPDYEIMIFNNAQQDQFIKEKYPAYYADFQRLPKLIQRSDFFRLAAIHHYGGIYCDIDIECTHSLDDLLDKTLLYTVEEEISRSRFKKEKQKGRYRGIDDCESSFVRYGNYAFGAVPSHWFMKAHMEDILKDIDWIIQSEPVDSKEQHEYWIYNTTATDRTTLELHKHNPTDLYTVKYPNQKVDDNEKLMYPLYFGKYGLHWCHGVWKINRDR